MSQSYSLRNRNSFPNYKEENDQRGQVPVKNESHSDQLYEVEAIRGHLPLHGTRQTVTAYFVKWKGYAEKDNSVTSSHELEKQLPAFLDSYWSEQSDERLPIVAYDTLVYENAELKTKVKILEEKLRKIHEIAK